MKNFFIKKIGKQFIKFIKYEDSGAFAVILALMIIPLMALAGAVVDYTKASSLRSEMQVATDSAALAVARVAKDDAVQMQIVAKDIYADNLFSTGIASQSTIVAIQIADGIRVDASYSMPTTFLQFIGINNLDLAIFSEINISASNLEVALVLDTTFSMNGAKISSLKVAARDMVTTLMEEETGGTVKIGLVPFSRYVNIGMSNRNEPGIDVPDDYSVARPDYCRNTYPDSTRSCDSRVETFPCTRDGVQTTCSRTIYYNCTGSRGAPVWVCTPRSPAQFRWYGCVGSRDYPLNIRDDSYGSEEVPGLLKSWNFCRSKPLTRLTNVRATVISGINAMNARDKTYIPVGLIWGWRLLSQGIPFTDAAPKSNDLKKVMVLMSDGDNTLSPNYPWHEVNNGSVADDLTEDLCDNIVNDDVIVYSIAFEVTNNATRSLLEGCAGNGGSYFDANNSGELADAFEEIADELMKLRVSK
ncbi:MAG: Tad domain-containing protein [Devosiaceae bacterium]|nr:Tad domain-containing protein [Devosiaceae bacterium]